VDGLRHIAASDGYRLAYRKWPAAGEPRATVLLLSGIMSNSAWFQPVAPLLRDFDLVGADRRGSGPNKEGWGDAPSAAQLVDDVVAIVDAERTEAPLVVVGWCWGAALAINVAAKIPVHGLLLVTPGLFNTAALEDAVKAQLGAPTIHTPVREEWFTHGPALDDFIRKDDDRVREMTPRMLDLTRKLATAAMIRLRKLGMPIVLVLAEHDEATDNAATAAAFKKVPNVEVVTLPTRHGVQFDAPEAVADLIRKSAS
jgi:pimeloyl-ACP methyl ester carboxylesterase